MDVRWSHCVLKVRDIEVMASFYCDAFGWEIADRGPFPGDHEIVFMTGSSTDHHQMALVNSRKDGPGGSLDHNAFRVDTIDDVKSVLAKMSDHEQVKYAVPITHGNAVSVYFADPEGNGVEIFCDTPWHVDQPVADTWDPSMTSEEILAALEQRYSVHEEFKPMDQYRAERAAHFGES